MLAPDGVPQTGLATQNGFSVTNRINGLWLLPTLASFLLWATFAILLWLGPASGSDFGSILELLGALGLLASGATAYLVYSLVDRCNRHYSQTQLLFWNSLEIIASKPGTPNSAITIRSAEESTSRLTGVENQRSAVLWALLTIIPLAGWFFMMMILWLLSRSLAKHSQLEGPVFEDLDRSLKSSGQSGIAGGSTPIIARNFLGAAVILTMIAELVLAPIVGYSGCLALMFLTLSSMSLLWLDLSITDPVRHFRNQSRIDAEIVRLLPTLNSNRIGD